MKNIPKVKIFQGGSDGFGHQLEGMLRLLSLSLNNKADYQYNYNKKYTFEHSNFNVIDLIKYISSALKILDNLVGKTNNKKSELNYNIIFNEMRTFDEIISQDINYRKNIYLYDGVGFGNALPPNFEPKTEVEKTLPILRKAFVEENENLPKPSYDNKFINVCVHLRMGDAVGTRVLDNEELCKVVKYFQKYNDKYRIIVHSDGNVNELSYENTIINDCKTDVLQILSDFIYADILIMNYSGLSISAHLLAKSQQIVINPNKAGVTFQSRILDKCIPAGKFIQDKKLENKTFSWEQHHITFLKNNKINGFGWGDYVNMNDNKIIAYFGERTHIITFNNDYTAFISISEDDKYIVQGYSITV